MHLIRYIKDLPDDKFIRVATAAIALDAIVVLVFLFCLGLFLSWWTLDCRFDYVSSFLEIVIALDASCSFDKVRKWIDERRASYVETHIVSVNRIANVQINESIGDVILPLHTAMQKIRRAIEIATAKSGLIIAIAATALLVVGFTDSMKPFAVMATAPVLFFYSAVLINYWFWKVAYERLQTGSTGVIAPVDDKNDLSIVAECTGPVSLMSDESKRKDNADE